MNSSVTAPLRLGVPRARPARAALDPPFNALYRVPWGIAWFYSPPVDRRKWRILKTAKFRISWCHRSFETLSQDPGSEYQQWPESNVPCCPWRNWKRQRILFFLGVARNFAKMLESWSELTGEMEHLGLLVWVWWFNTMLFGANLDM